jgi:alpha-tubulin suppressor-like RCC1 family protein
MSFVSSRGSGTCRGTGQFLGPGHQNTPIPPRPTPVPGGLYVFGINSYGECGVGNTNSINTLTQVGNSTDWATGGTTVSSTGSTYNIMIKSNGAMYGTGLNNLYQLGFGNTTNVSTFTQIGSSTDWAWVAKGTNDEGTIAIKTNGDLYSWGYNNYGSLGQSNLTIANTTTWQSTTRANITTPTIVPNVNNVIQVVKGTVFTAILKDDGTIWTCGYNNQGQLAIGGTRDVANVYPSFQQEATAKNTWVYIACSDDKLFAIDAVNNLYMAGRDWQGANTYYTTLSTNGLPALPTNGFVSVSFSDIGAFTAVTPNGDVYYLGANTLGSAGSTLVWTDSTINAILTQTTDSYTGRLDNAGNIYLSTSNSTYQINSAISWESFDYKGQYPNGSGVSSGVSWFIGN